MRHLILLLLSLPVLTSFVPQSIHRPAPPLYISRKDRLDSRRSQKAPPPKPTLRVPHPTAPSTTASRRQRQKMPTSRYLHYDGVFGALVDTAPPSTPPPPPPAPPNLLKKTFKNIESPSTFATTLSTTDLPSLNSSQVGYLLNLALAIDATAAVDTLLERHHTLPPPGPNDALLLVKAYARAGRIDLAQDLIDNALPRDTAPDYLSASLAAISISHFAADLIQNATATLTEITALGSSVRELEEPEPVPWLGLIHAASRAESRRRKALSTTVASGSATPSKTTNPVLAVLATMSSHPTSNSDSIYESLSNALVRRVNFVTGAVSMATLPPPDRGECAFIGRSNVGKSSLVNMLCNRKALAFTSKRPGKTQQFNYFAVNDKPEIVRELKYGDEVGGKRDEDSFYIVDPPGYGFAKVSERATRRS